MAGGAAAPRAAFIALLSALLAVLMYSLDLRRALVVFGAARKPRNTAFADPKDLVVFDDTTHCEDLHYHEVSGLLFTACEASVSTRFSWLPALAIFDSPSAAANARGSIHIIDPKTMAHRKLKLEEFAGPFVTHGIDVISDPGRPDGEAVYIYAVNHIPNIEYYGKGYDGAPENPSAGVPKSRSQVEIFHHAIGSDAARHVRSVWDPLMTTPNDIVALSPTSFFVTNDHFYKEGKMRELEDVYFGAKWSNTIHIGLSGLDAGKGAVEGVTATVALDRMHNNNGLGHGRLRDEILVVNCASGVLNIGRVSAEETGGPIIEITESVPLDSVIDNPSYFSDPFANDTYDASMFVLAGLSRAIILPRDKHNPSAKIPVIVWGAKPVPSREKDGPDGWEKRILFEDDGNRISTASVAVLVAIDPVKEGGRRRGWLFVSGFMSANIVAAKVDL